MECPEIRLTIILKEVIVARLVYSLIDLLSDGSVQQGASQTTEHSAEFLKVFQALDISRSLTGSEQCRLAQ